MFDNGDKQATIRCWFHGVQMLTYYPLCPLSAEMIHETCWDKHTYKKSKTNEKNIQFMTTETEFEEFECGSCDRDSNYVS